MTMAKKKGVHCGRPRILPAKVVDNIKRQRAQGKTLQAIASTLNDKGIRTAHNGSQWYPSTVRAVLRSEGFVERRTAARRVARVRARDF
jgi:hypothetical protein